MGQACGKLTAVLCASLTGLPCRDLTRHGSMLDAGRKFLMGGFSSQHYWWAYSSQRLLPKAAAIFSPAVFLLLVHTMLFVSARPLLPFSPTYKINQNFRRKILHSAGRTALVAINYLHNIVTAGCVNLDIYSPTRLTSHDAYPQPYPR